MSSSTPKRVTEMTRALSCGRCTYLGIDADDLAGHTRLNHRHAEQIAAGDLVDVTTAAAAASFTGLPVAATRAVWDSCVESDTPQVRAERLHDLLVAARIACLAGHRGEFTLVKAPLPGTDRLPRLVKLVVEVDPHVVDRHVVIRRADEPSPQ